MQTGMQNMKFDSELSYQKTLSYAVCFAYLKFILPHHCRLIKTCLLKESQSFTTNNEQLKQPGIPLGLNDIANLKTRAFQFRINEY